MRIILAGNPNTGKTTLFNTLTNSFEHASNWHGVTVDVKSKKYTFKNKEFEACDLPGLYSLDAYSKEEKIASDFIDQNQDSIVVCLLDANNLRRNLFLALEIKERTQNVIFVVNMAKEVKTFDAKKLEEKTGVKTISIDARSKKSVKNLKREIFDFVLKNNFPIVSNRKFEIDEFEKKCKIRFQKIAEILNEIEYKTNGVYGDSKIDKFVLSRVGAFFVFALVMAGVFFLTFGFVGDWLSSKFNDFFAMLSEKISFFLSEKFGNSMLITFVDEGILSGVLSVAGFLPQIILLFACLNFLEDFGYLSRVALMFDPFLKKLGLNGRATFSMIMGFGCTTTAIMTSRNLDNKSLQKRTTVLLPFMSCSAKLPIFAVIVSTFFEKYKALMVFSLYMFSILIMVVVAMIFAKKDKSEEKQTFIMEMPKYRVPNFSKIFKNTLSTAKNFIFRVGGAIILSSMVVFVLYNFDFMLHYVGDNSEKSILFSLSKLLTPIFSPLGFGSVGAVIAIFSGFVAKEMVVSSLAIVNKVSVDELMLSLTLPSSAVCFSPASALSFAVFVLLYTPCVSACIMMKKEVGRKTMWLSVVLQFCVAYVSSFLVFNLLNSILSRHYAFFTGLVIIVALLVLFVIKYLKKKEIRCKQFCGGRCGECTKH